MRPRCGVEDLLHRQAAHPDVARRRARVASLALRLLGFCLASRFGVRVQLGLRRSLEGVGRPHRALP
eukprot:7885616-Alexandrium_andersonii.AAC.1